MNAQLAAIRAAAAAKYKTERGKTQGVSPSSAPSSTTRKRRKATAPVKNRSSVEQKQREEEGDGGGDDDKEEEESFVAREFKKRKMDAKDPVQFYGKNKEKFVLEFLHETASSSGGLTKLLDKQGHLDSRRSAFFGGAVEADLLEQFLSGSKSMNKYHLRQEEASRKKKVLVARYYRSTGSRKLLEEPVMFLTKEECVSVLGEAVERSGTRRRKADAAKLVTYERMMQNCPTLFWNVVYHFKDVSDVVANIQSSDNSGD